MKVVAIPVPNASHEALDSAESEGKKSLGLLCEELCAGGVGTPAKQKCYKLKFDEEGWQSLYTVDASSTPAVAFFTEHYPTEFEATAHYLKDKIGDDIEPAAELPEAAPEGPKVVASPAKP